MIKKMKGWFKKNITRFVLSLYNVEKNILSNTDQLASDTVHTKRYSEGQLADSLINGEITQEVKNLRWRTYKIINEVNGVKSDIIGYDEDDMPIVKTYKIDKKSGLENIKTEPSDDYKLDLVVNNDEITINTSYILTHNNLDILETPIINVAEDSATLATIDSSTYNAAFKPEKKIKIVRSHFPKFELEKYTHKLHVRKIDDKKRLLEFYISQYKNDENPMHNHFIKYLNKIKNGFNDNSLFSMDEINFITNNTLGANDNEIYTYGNINFDKIVMFNGYYVVKLVGDVILNGKNIFDEYIEEMLEEKYKNKTRK